MSELFFEEIDESEVIGRGRGSKKLPEWLPILTWGTPDLTDRFWEERGYGDLTEDDVEFVTKVKAEALAKQHAFIDRELEIWGVRRRNVLEIRNQKEVRVKL
jgi:hypothetical protein